MIENSSRVYFYFVVTVLLFSVISAMPHFASRAISADLLGENTASGFAFMRVP